MSDDVIAATASPSRCDILDISLDSSSSEYLSCNSSFSDDNPVNSSIIEFSNKFNNHHLIAGHLNVSSLRNHIDELKLCVENSNFGVLAISETWLVPSITNKSVAIPGYKLIRNDRDKRLGKARGGGVAIYIHESFKYKQVLHSENSNIEYLFIEILRKGLKILVGVIYRPPNKQIV